MSFEIESWHIASVVGVIVIAVFVYLMQQNRKDKAGEREIKGRMHAQPTEDILGKDRPVRQAKPSEPERVEPRMPEPVPKAPEPEPEPEPVVSPHEQTVDDVRPWHQIQTQEEPEQVDFDFDAETSSTNERLTAFGRQSPAIDSAVEAVCHFQPRHFKFFETEKLKSIDHMIAEGPMAFEVTVDFYNEQKKQWNHSWDHNISCSQIYLTMQLANRRRGLTEIDASCFISLAERIAIELEADAAIPDAVSMVAQAAQVREVVAAFDQSFPVWLKSEQPVDDDELRSAAQACGFSWNQTQFEKREVGMHDPLFVLKRDEANPDNIVLLMDMPLAVPANDPLGAFFELANDLCCRLNLTMCFMNGQPIDSYGACYIASQIKPFFASMAGHGVAAGSRRSRRIFSRA